MDVLFNLEMTSYGAIKSPDEKMKNVVTNASLFFFINTIESVAFHKWTID